MTQTSSQTTIITWFDPKTGQCRTDGFPYQASLLELTNLPSTILAVPPLIDLRTQVTKLSQIDNAAKRGGYGSVIVSPTIKPIPDDLANWQFLTSQAKNHKTRVIILGALTQGLESKALSELKTLTDAGCIGFSNGHAPLINADLLRLALIVSKELECPISVPLNDPDLLGNGCAHLGALSTRLGLPGIPSSNETTVLARNLALLEEVGGRLHCGPLSTAESVALISQAKDKGLSVTADTTPHHLCLTDETLIDYDTHKKVFPPLRTEVDRQALIEGLKTGVIDAIASDHTPVIPEEKDRAFDGAPIGTLGLETAFATCYTHLVLTNQITLDRLIQAFTIGPSRLFNPSSFSTDAEFVIIDTQSKSTVTPGWFDGDAHNSCFLGDTFTGQPIGWLRHKQWEAIH